MTELAIVLVGLGASFLVGVTSIGGVLVLPLLVVALGLPPYEVIPAAMISFILPSLIALVIVHRRGALDLRASAALWSGAIPGALAGGLILPWMPVELLLWAIVAMLVASAVRVLSRAKVVAPAATDPSQGALAASGLGVGLVSALTGTGGPVTLMPLLSLARVEPRRAVMLCQSITLPITVFASAGYVSALRLDWTLIALLAGSSTAGIVAGMAVAPRIRVMLLARVIGVMMAATAAILGIRLLTS